MVGWLVGWFERKRGSRHREREREGVFSLAIPSKIAEIILLRHFEFECAYVFHLIIPHSSPHFTSLLLFHSRNDCVILFVCSFCMLYFWLLSMAFVSS